MAKKINELQFKVLIILIPNHIPFNLLADKIILVNCNNMQYYNYYIIIKLCHLVNQH